MKDVTGAGQISPAIVRLAGYGKKIVPGGKNMDNCKTISKIILSLRYAVTIGICCLIPVKPKRRLPEEIAPPNQRLHFLLILRIISPAFMDGAIEFNIKGNTAKSWRRICLHIFRHLARSFHAI